ncbi:MAG TPA: HIT family protein [Azoarcus taiwanensis]|uniref:HIT domain-containing protein n=1 Tax=Azoarcus taiwanensis TaxID=666964 RepID=A0A972J9A4_9RHOO|nr:HIT family protein [Azoarcus taiwanensis]NMG01778.1 HIT domain-containing protein [Azoarcus taiwanensis]HRQ56372.1 HIT family protein [Azoarcus taiwanensis]
MTCPLCVPVAETVLWQDEACRVIAVDDQAFPGFCRVVWSAHVAEMSDLLPAERQHLLDVVLATEKALRSLMQPDKINLASLGNLVPHLHWHVIPRFRDDANFPDPIWAPVRRDGTGRTAPPGELLAQAIESSLRET